MISFLCSPETFSNDHNRVNCLKVIEENCHVTSKSYNTTTVYKSVCRHHW